MKQLILLTIVLTSLFGCKSNEKKEDTLLKPNMEEEIVPVADKNNTSLQLGCYEYITDRDMVKMEITKIEGNTITAKLNYAYAEKDKNEGTFIGILEDDTLIGNYTFMSEGIQSVRDLAFKVNGDEIVEGYGELNDDGTTFKDTSKINYQSTNPLKKTDCE